MVTDSPRQIIESLVNGLRKNAPKKHQDAARRPLVVWVMGIPWRINWYDNLENVNVGTENEPDITVGSTHATRLAIDVCTKGHAVMFVKATLMHEILHATLAVGGGGIGLVMSKKELEEIACVSLEYGLTTLFVDPRNEALRNWLTHGDLS